MLDAFGAVPATQSREACRGFRRLTRNAQHRFELSAFDAASQRDVRRPLTGQAVRQWAGQQVRAAHPMYRRRAGRAARRSARSVGPARRSIGRTAAAPRRCTDSGSCRAIGSSNASTSGAIRSATATVTCGRPAGARPGRSAASRSSQICRSRASVSASKSSSTECTISRARPVTQSRSNACALIAVNSAALSWPAPAGSSARIGPRRTSADLLDASTTPGGSGQLPITSPANGRFMRGKRFQRQRGVVEGAELGGGDHQHRGVPGRPPGRATSRRRRRVRRAARRRPRPESAAPDGQQR